MSAESRLKRGDNPEDVQKLFPAVDVAALQQKLGLVKAPKKKAARKAK